MNKIKTFLDDARAALISSAEHREADVWIERADHPNIWVGSVEWQMGDMKLAVAQLLRAVAVCIPGPSS